MRSILVFAMFSAVCGACDVHLEVQTIAEIHESLPGDRNWELILASPEGSQPVRLNSGGIPIASGTLTPAGQAELESATRALEDAWNGSYYHRDDFVDWFHYQLAEGSDRAYAEASYRIGETPRGFARLEAFARDAHDELLGAAGDAYVVRDPAP
jgi:hypothetical protein